MFGDFKYLRSNDDVQSGRRLDDAGRIFCDASVVTGVFSVQLIRDQVPGVLLKGPSGRVHKYALKCVYMLYDTYVHVCTVLHKTHVRD